MTDEELAAFRSYPKSKLIEFVSGDVPTSPYHIAAKYELDRRAGLFGRRIAVAALIVSVLSLIISWCSYTVSHSPARPNAPATHQTP